ncbi:hypothetical protein FS837_003220, partial [Tulasnella sp. UAMH 9824]
MAQRIQRPSSAPPSNNQPPGPPLDLGGKVHDARQAVLSILKDTDWPKQASNDAQDLIRKLEAPLVLDKLPKEGTEGHDQIKTATHQLLGQLESVQTRLKRESEKYGTKKKGFKKIFKGFFSRNDSSQCAGVDLLERFEAENDQRLSRVAGDRSKGPQDTGATQSTSTSNPPVNAQSDITATAVPPNIPPAPSAAQRDQVTSSKSGKQEGSSARVEWLNAANKAFKVAEG